MDKVSIIILAAGKGSRMKSSKPKVLHDISGKPMVYHIIKEARKISDDISIVLAHQRDIVSDEILKYFKDITFFEQDDINFPGTGGALRNIHVKHDRVLILNGDMPLITADALKPFLTIDADIVLSVLHLENPHGYGRVKIHNNEVQYIIEQKDASDEELMIRHVNAGVYAFTKNVLTSYINKIQNNNAQNEFYLTDIIALAKQDRLTIIPLIVDEKQFGGVNSKKDLASAEIIMQNRIKSRWMTDGVVMQLPDTIYIEDGVQFKGECIIENNCRITGDSIIKNSHIKASCVIEDSFVCDSDIGPLAHLRPQSKLTNTHIGNFVEVKKSSLDGVKAGHLSYIGDANVQSGTNIGAGVITCNYDGLKKYQTKIGKNVFIGSDSQLIAPIEIEDDVMIAAGTTLSCKKVPKGSLAISRVKIKFIEHFFYKFFKK